MIAISALSLIHILQALLDSEARGENPNGKITLVVASKPGVYALERAAVSYTHLDVYKRQSVRNGRGDRLLCRSLQR